jgi:adenine-specific DNA methylase
MALLETDMPVCSPENRIGESPLADSERVSGLVRPVQFLGAKTKALPLLLELLDRELAEGAAVADLFSGSSLVSQGLARNGHVVSSFDALEHCTYFARAFLGSGRRDSEALPELPLDWEGSQARSEAWQPWLERERSAIEALDDQELIDLSREIPQVWRPQGAAAELSDGFAQLLPGSRPSFGLVSAHYAGTYFSLEQAIEIDAIRAGIGAARRSGAIGSWQESLLIAALLSAASNCVFSAGKHYAQPHRIRDDKDLTFIRKRLLEDRSKGLRRLFEIRLRSFFQAAQAGGSHSAETKTLEDLILDPAGIGHVDAIYADPPYTAQQYSRFYHVPEVISSYRVPALQQIDGKATRGLYPEPVERHHSRFCSRREAPDAFRDLCRLTVAKEAILCLSYSFTRSGESGNRRSIDLASLRCILESHFTDIEEHEVDLTYRQFNASGASVSKRSDAEILIVAKNPRA